jgi:hypothetical protein
MEISEREERERQAKIKEKELDEIRQAQQLILASQPPPVQAPII